MYRYTPFGPSCPSASACSGALQVSRRQEVTAGRWSSCPNSLWYDATYVVFAVTATGVENDTRCQPVALSFVNVACASWMPLFDHKWPGVWADVLQRLCRNARPVM